MNKKKYIFFFFFLVIKTAKADLAGFGNFSDRCGMEPLLFENRQGSAADLLLPFLNEFRIFDFHGGPFGSKVVIIIPNERSVYQMLSLMSIFFHICH